jgi:hypothetical protein
MCLARFLKNKVSPDTLDDPQLSFVTSRQTISSTALSSPSSFSSVFFKAAHDLFLWRPSPCLKLHISPIAPVLTF